MRYPKLHVAERFLEHIRQGHSASQGKTAASEDEDAG
jgi:hypothetical protein